MPIFHRKGRGILSDDSKNRQRAAKTNKKGMKIIQKQIKIHDKKMKKKAKQMGRQARKTLRDIERAGPVSSLSSGEFARELRTPTPLSSREVSRELKEMEEESSHNPSVPLVNNEGPRFLATWRPPSFENSDPELEEELEELELAGKRSRKSRMKSRGRRKKSGRKGKSRKSY